MDRRLAPLPLQEVQPRLHALQHELKTQLERMARLIAACQETAAGLGRGADLGAPRLFARDVVRLGEAELLVARQAVRHAEGSHRLTPTEWQLLTFLLAEPGTVHSRVELAVGAWGPGYAERNSEVEVYVSRLRRKLGPSGRLLETVRGRGYRLVLDGHGAVDALAQPALAVRDCQTNGNGLAASPAHSRA